MKLTGWDSYLCPPSLQEGTQEVPLAGGWVLAVTTGCLTDQLFEEEEGSDDPCCGCTRMEEQIQAPMAAYKRIGLDLQVTGRNNSLTSSLRKGRRVDNTSPGFETSPQRISVVIAAALPKNDFR